MAAAKLIKLALEPRDAYSILNALEMQIMVHKERIDELAATNEPNAGMAESNRLYTAIHAKVAEAAGLENESTSLNWKMTLSVDED